MADLVTTSEYKAYAGITSSSDDALISVLIDIASALIRRYCGRDLVNGFESASRTELYDGNDGPELQLREWPVTSITSVSEINDAGDSTTLPANDYRVNRRNGILYRIGSVTGRFASDTYGELVAPGFGWSPSWCGGFQNYSVVYESANAVTDDLKFAVYQLIDWMFASRRSNPTMQSESLGSYAYTRLSMSDDPQAVVVRSICSTFKTGGLS